MNKAGKILRLLPEAVLPNGELFIEVQDFSVEGDFGVIFDGERGRIISATADRIIVQTPTEVSGIVSVQLECDGERSAPARLIVGRKIAEDLHIVANPAVDPSNGSILVTNSGSRGQQMPISVFRLQTDGELREVSGDILNPTGIAFDRSGQAHITARADGIVYRLNRDDDALPFVSDLGVATGIAFDANDTMFVGDRHGTIYKINGIGESDVFATLEPSVAAYHLAFSADGDLFLTAPNVSSFDSIKKIDRYGEVSTYFQGLGRPQGLAFDTDGNLYAAASYRSRRGIVRITPDGEASLFISGYDIIGLCFTKRGDVIAATDESLYSLPLNIRGLLLENQQ